MSPAELQARLHEPQLRLFDTTVLMARKPEGGYEIKTGREAYSTAHIAGAAFLDLLHDFSAPDAPLNFTLPTAEQFAVAAGRAGIGADSAVVLYNSGPTWWATRMWFMLREFGFDRAAVLDGGLDRWRAEGRALSAELVHHQPAEFPLRSRRSVFIGKADVKRALDGRDAIVVNALAAEVHSGRVAPYARPGRIAGSCHLFALDLLDSSQSFHSEPELRERLAAAGLLAGPPVIAYCGGGISATTTAFALHLIGRDDVQIYDGSLSEWSRDPAMPMEVDP
jgi:thiosulfate/3-mercaptopyruvate sulfurtransferase